MKKMFLDNIVKIIAGTLSVLAVLVGLLVGGYLKAPPSDLSLGAFPGNEIQFPTLIVGGVERAYLRMDMTATSSSLCVFRNPWRATSTILSFSTQFTRGVVGVNTVDLSTTTATDGYGSSTPALIFGRSIPTTNAPTIVWQPNSATTTKGNGSSLSLLGTGILPGFDSSMSESNYILGPTEFLTLRLATATPAGVFAAPYQGRCNATLEKIQ